MPDTYDPPIPESQSAVCEKLKALLSQVPPQSVWRDIFDSQGNCLAKGAGVLEDGIDASVNMLDFQGKSVLDLGCNFGHNSFLAIKGGARSVTGVDNDPLAIQGARLMASMRGATGAEFIEGDFKTMDMGRRFDMVMLIDSVGKEHVGKGRLGSTLDVLKRLARNEIVLTLRPIYRIRKHFKMTEEECAALYPGPRVQGKHFHLALRTADMLEPDWRLVSPLESPLYDEDTDKVFLHFVKK